jgi:tRNA/tmRNA/rRNA uracil-C5-methylase (TrmA/RlmC/RlmD family)
LKSHRVIPISDKCEVVGPQVIANLDELRRLARETTADSIETFESGDMFAAVAVEEREGGEEVSIEVGRHTYHLSTAAFFQVNRHLLPKLIERMMALATSTTGRRRAIDLYAGVGFFSLPLASAFQQVTSVESSARSHHFARRNLRKQKNVEVVRASVEEFVASDRADADLIVVDPPRAGVEHGALDQIASRARSKICYLSCDPVTFSRDASLLLRRGWALRTLELFDLFPNTHHIETLSSFERAQ